MGSEEFGRVAKGKLRGYLWLASALLICPCHIPLVLALVGGTAFASLVYSHWLLAVALSMGYAVVALLFAYRGLNGKTACAIPGVGRNPVLALVLSALLPGLGQSYNRQWIKAGAFFVAGAAVGWPLVSSTPLPDHLQVSATLLLVAALSLAAVEVWSIVDAYRVARAEHR
jgi:mercuric ion transport protein